MTRSGGAGEGHARDLTADGTKDFLNRSVQQYVVLSLLSDGNSSTFGLRGWEGSL